MTEVSLSFFPAKKHDLPLTPSKIQPCHEIMKKKTLTKIFSITFFCLIAYYGELQGRIGVIMQNETGYPGYRLVQGPCQSCTRDTKITETSYLLVHQ